MSIDSSRGTQAARAVAGGGLAGLLSMLVLAWRGRSDSGSALAPLNAPSHWIHGDEALHVVRPTLRHTLAGLLIHHASAVFWGGIYDQLLRRVGPRRPLRAAEIAAGAAGLAVVAAVVDLKLVPQRLTPGFEHRLSTRSLVLTYAAFGAGLALAAWLQRPVHPHGSGRAQ